jgi:arginine/lysine/ornithine decarboxylase
MSPTRINDLWLWGAPPALTAAAGHVLFHLGIQAVAFPRQGALIDRLRAEPRQVTRVIVLGCSEVAYRETVEQAPPGVPWVFLPCPPQAVHPAAELGLTCLAAILAATPAVPLSPPPPEATMGAHEEADLAAMTVFTATKLLDGGTTPTPEQVRAAAANSQDPLPTNELAELRSLLYHELSHLIGQCQRADGADQSPLDELCRFTCEGIGAWESLKGRFEGNVPAAIFAHLRDGAYAEARKLADEQIFRPGYYGRAAAGPPGAGQPEVPPARPLVRVLFVDNSPSFLALIDHEFRPPARACAEFTIEVVTASTAENALKQVRTDSYIQAAVLDWGLDGETAAGLLRELRQGWGYLTLAVMTGRDVIALQLQAGDLLAGVRVFQKNDRTALAELLRVVVEGVRARAATPFFTALEQYSRRPVSVFHAQITSGGRSLRRSDWLGAFYDFYGLDFFNGETTTTLAPLDSLLAPTGSLAEAQRQAARVWGADETFFCTNGTSGAIKVVYQGLLRPEDEVLIDRCCHKAHHYGLVLVGARPVYLQSEPLAIEDDGHAEFTGIWKGVRTRTILEALQEHPTAKMLSLTNCTFDGYIHRADRVVEEVRKKLAELKADQALTTALANQGQKVTDPDDFIFLFDEAWFGYAAFLPHTRPFTAMAAAARHPTARVYAVQSTHKTLTAFRQGSMIHARDPRLADRATRHMFQEALYTHTTTSPSYNMLASLDAGRMQADLEGRRLWGEAWRLVARLRDALAADRGITQHFRVLSATDMDASIPGEDPAGAEWLLDPTKVTLVVRRAAYLSGSQARTRLLRDYNIQFNKITNNTCLLMVNGGSTPSTVTHLIASLQSLARSLGPPGQPRPPETVPHGLLTVEFHNRIPDLRGFFFGTHPALVGLERMELDLREDIKLSEPDGAEDGAVLSATGKPLVSAAFVIPYPPGVPLLLPGQVVKKRMVRYLRNIKNPEVHGLPDGRLLAWWEAGKGAGTK